MTYKIDRTAIYGGGKRSYEVPPTPEPDPERTFVGPWLRVIVAVFVLLLLAGVIKV